MSQKNKEEPTEINLRQSFKSFAFGWFVIGVALIVVAIPGLLVNLYQQYTGSQMTELFGFAPSTVLFYSGLCTAILAFCVQIAIPLIANEYQVTDDEIIETYGIIRKRTRITRLAHIRSVNVDISIVGRILGYGDVFYYTAGSDDVDVTLHNVANPTQIADLIKELTDKAADAEKARKKDEGDLGGDVSSVLYDVADRIIASFELVAQSQRQQQRGIESFLSSLQSTLSRIDQKLQADGDLGSLSRGERPGIEPGSSSSHEPQIAPTVTAIDNSGVAWSRGDLEDDSSEEEPTYSSSIDAIAEKHRSDQSAKSTDSVAEEDVTLEPSLASSKAEPAKADKATRSEDIDLSPGYKGKKAADERPQPPLESAPPHHLSSSQNENADQDATDSSTAEDPAATPEETWSPALRGVRCEVTGYYTDN